MRFDDKDIDWLGTVLADAAVKEIMPRFRRLGAGDIRQKTSAADLVTDAARLDDAPDLVVEVHGPRERVGVGPLLEDRDRPAALCELDAEDQPDRAGTDDGDVDRAVGDRDRRPGRCTGRR